MKVEFRAVELELFMKTHSITSEMALAENSFDFWRDFYAFKGVNVSRTPEITSGALNSTFVLCLSGIWTGFRNGEIVIEIIGVENFLADSDFVGITKENFVGIRILRYFHASFLLETTLMKLVLTLKALSVNKQSESGFREGLGSLTRSLSPFKKRVNTVGREMSSLRV